MWMLPVAESPSETPFEELLRLAELHPALSLLQVIELLDRERWDIETLTPAQRALYGRINARAALARLHGSVDDFQSGHALDAPARSPQWLATGRHLCVSGLLDAQTRARLVAQCDATLSVPGKPPIRLFSHPDCMDQAELRSIASAVLAALPDPLPPGTRPTILKRRTILRRTFPPSRLPSQPGNANNQFWHQDSNAQFNDSPMLTLWIPLQDHAGVTRPGLQISDAPVANFSIFHGDSSRDIGPMLAQMFPASQIVSPQVAAGECLVFNGLTFHRTLATPAMAEHRDALLIRVLDQRTAHRFPVADHDQDLLPLA
ncbi:hypothetical protein IHE29_02040 (plasmid) [Mycetohabitans rhizoxinica]|uniref:Phytanoyl-CoA dioxygenase n=2 Tax=Mycetohabitans rhizoxinica TaxID=412963 RepID=A0ABZ2PSR4_9BURK